MTEVNGNELLAFLDQAIDKANGNGWAALFELNELVSEEEEVRYALSA